ncbi:cytochrome P450 [Auricularia subglabra TFB-10046 SS5]|nr:cytochrome P450 [Auricularia subglabra TFB-10046 SS5]
MSNSTVGTLTSYLPPLEAPSDLWTPALIFLGAMSLAYLARPSKTNVPSVGAQGLFSSWLNGLKSVKATREMVQQGYEKFGGAIFKLPALDRPVLIVSSPEQIEEMRRAPANVLSFTAAVQDMLQTEFMFGSRVTDESRFHVTIIRTVLSRHLPVIFPEVLEEVAQSFKEYVPNCDDDWVKVPAFDTVMKVVARATSRLFVGLPLCRNTGYLDLIIRYTGIVGVSARVLGLFPSAVKPFVTRYMTPLPRTFKQAVQYLEPIVEDHRAKLKEHGSKWEDKPSDLITWILETATGADLETRNVITRVLRFNFAALHTTGMTFTYALYHLAAEEKKYLQPLRAEIEEIVSRDGWTKASVDKMKKLDSFMRESHRHHGLGVTSMQRKALVDFRFADGTFVPKGTHIAAASKSRQFDDQVYPHAMQFDGFRFVNDDQAEDELAQDRFVSVSVDYLPFGLGRTACPGRFWAANEMKIMFAYLIYNYDVKMEHEGELPESMWFGTSEIPNGKANIMLRKRKL